MGVPHGNSSWVGSANRFARSYARSLNFPFTRVRTRSPSRSSELVTASRPAVPDPEIAATSPPLEDVSEPLPDVRVHLAELGTAVVDHGTRHRLQHARVYLDRPREHEYGVHGIGRGTRTRP